MPLGDLVSDQVKKTDQRWSSVEIQKGRYFIAEPPLDTLPDDIQNRWRSIKLHLVQATAGPAINPYQLI